MSENSKERKNKILTEILRSVRAVDGKLRQAEFETITSK